MNNEPVQILDCVTSMVYKCIDNEKLFSFFFFNFYGKSINNWYEEKESEFLVSWLVWVVVSNFDAWYSTERFHFSGQQLP